MLKRIWNLITGFFSRLLGKVEENNPELLIEREKENLRKNIAKFNEQLAKNAGLVEELAEQDATMDKEAESLEAKVKILIRKGDTTNAAAFASRLKQNRAANEELEARLEAAKVQFEELTKARIEAQRMAEEKIRQIELDLGEAKSAEALAEMNTMASGMINKIGGTGDTINRLEESVRKRKTAAKGRSTVAKQQLDDDTLLHGDITDDDVALAEFMAEQGMEIESDTIAGTMGPVEKS